MNGYCKPKETGIYFDGERFSIAVNDRQKWQYGIMNGKNIVKVSRDNVRLYLSKDEFENDWDYDR